jgi:O-acetyl-ADP-ribose deacetylase (regulator of RNase III)
MGDSRRIKSARELFYITHIDNLVSIMDRGILSHERIEKEGIPYTPIYNKEIVKKRKDKKTPNGKSLWSFANLFFNARNAMLYKVSCERSVDDIALLGVAPLILKQPNVLVTTGNAASDATSILPSSRKTVSKILKEIDREYWNPYDGSKRKMMAECLVPDEVPMSLINSIYVASFRSMNKAKEVFGTSYPHGRPIVPQPYLFFQPKKVINLLPNLSLADGDMFFSRAHTLTVSVNTVGVMGKGVASRAKDQFGDVYVTYQKACRRRSLRMGKPFLYKREQPSDLELADEPASLKNHNSGTWFLLFATKRHWRDRADIQGIEKGLQWLTNNYKKEGIKSLAIPALGCGLGRLNWQDVGPLLCKYLSAMDIPVTIYLPLEKKISEELLTKEFLLPSEQTRLHAR